MERFDMNTVTRDRSDRVIVTNALIRNTYTLLSMTLLFSAFTAFLAIASNARPVSIGLFFIGALGLQYLTFHLRNSVWGILSTFAFTGFMGYTLGPLVGFYLRLANGPEIVTAALGLTGAIFFALSAYAMTTRKDFSYLGGFLIAGMMVVFIASLISLFLYVPVIHLVISSAIILIFSGYILYDTSSMIHNGQQNYILLTISLYLSIYNLFISLLHILGALGGRSD